MIGWIIGAACLGVLAGLLLRRSPQQEYDALSFKEMKRRMVGDKTPMF